MKILSRRGDYGRRGRSWWRLDRVSNLMDGGGLRGLSVVQRGLDVVGGFAVGRREGLPYNGRSTVWRWNGK